MMTEFVQKHKLIIIVYTLYDIRRNKHSLLYNVPAKKHIPQLYVERSTHRTAAEVRHVSRSSYNAYGGRRTFIISLKSKHQCKLKV